MLLCETTVKGIIPNIKANIAKVMKTKGKKQREIAKTLGVTEAAVSMYLSGLRGASAAKKLDAVKLKQHKEICNVCTTMQTFCKGVQ